MSDDTHAPSAPHPTDASDPVAALAERFRLALRSAFSDLPEAHAAAQQADPLITPGRNRQFGDFQSNAAMPLAKVAGMPPREVAKRIVRHLDLGDLAEPVTEAAIAGPGFINITLRADALARALGAMSGPDLGLPPVPPEERRTVVVDLCGVNLAKQMHVGHLRSIIIGDSVARAIERLGHRVIRQNHVGDWGLPIAMVTDQLMRMQAKGRDIAGLDLDSIERIYKSAQADCAADERGLAAARRWWSHPKAMAELEAQVSGAREALASAKATLLKLQSGDAATRAVWQRIADTTMRECLAVCARLGADVRAEHSAGESAYADELDGLVKDLLDRGVAELDDGAVVVRVEGIEEPCIIRKSEAGGGGYLYATTDMAAIRRRVQQMKADRVVYCVDSRQGLHFKQVFGASRKAGYAGSASLEHAANGTILGPDGRPFKTRSGENVKLSALLDEAASRAREAVAAKNPDLSAEDAAAIAETVGVAAIKYADLSSDRIKDYVFSFDRMLSFEGNTGPYLLYAVVRIRSIFRKAGERGVDVAAIDRAAVAVSAPEEKDLALALLRYPASVRGVAEHLEPHRLCQYLYDLASAFSGFVTNCPVLQAPDDATRSARLALCRLTDRVMSDGLMLLGIRPLDRM